MCGLFSKAHVTRVILYQRYVAVAQSLSLMGLMLGQNELQSKKSPLQKFQGICNLVVERFTFCSVCS